MDRRRGCIESCPKLEDPLGASRNNQVPSNVARMHVHQMENGARGGAIQKKYKYTLRSSSEEGLRTPGVALLLDPLNDDCQWTRASAFVHSIPGSLGPPA